MGSSHIPLGFGPESGLRIVQSFVVKAQMALGTLEARPQAVSVSPVPSGRWVGLGKAVGQGPGGCPEKLPSQRAGVIYSAQREAFDLSRKLK